MNTAVRLLEEEKTFTEMINRYIREMQTKKQKNPEKAQKEAKEILVRTGVATESGETKDKIVSWE